MVVQVACLWICTYVPEQRGSTPGSKTDSARRSLTTVYRALAITCPVR